MNTFAAKMLKEIRQQLGYDGYPVTQQYKPLPDRHPLLGSVTKKKPVPQRRDIRTPPERLPKMRTTPPPEMDGHESPSFHSNKYNVIPPLKTKRAFMRMRTTPPPEMDGHESPSFHSNKYNVIPPLKTKRAFMSPPTPKQDANDSWGEEEEGSSDEDAFPMPGYHGYPYPMVMYPYPMMVAPPPQVTPRKSKSKKGKKKVHYRNTPTYLSSREHTKHEPMEEGILKVPPDQRTNSVLMRYQDVTDYWDFAPDFSKHYVDTFIEECLDDVIIPDLLIEVLSDEDQMPSSHPDYPSSFYYCEDFLDEEIPKLVREVINDASYQMVGGHLLRQHKHDPLEEFLNSLLEDVIHKETTAIVKDVAKDIVNEHMEKAAAYNEIQNMIGQVIQEMGPDVIEEAFMENMLDDLLEENVIQPEMMDQSQEVAVEMLTHYSNKVRSRDIRQIKKNSGEKLQDSLSLDYLLAYIARQGDLWTEGEHANKLLDEISLNILLTEFTGIQQKKRATVDNKPARRYYEKIVTDVTLDILLEEISQSLDEDMADLDEYEQGLENPDVNYEMPKQLKKWLEGR
ncbi:hypothetical protein LSH36_4g11046 [Paralvinella palmiformis]|uniref:Uncharacterized protein n=1 Tax=Paralvinella palmiformis TaxID=53620 RepID=A0AAD9KEC0_9ANNE|nr:hypothetical protein LSH36_4g11046 [Paralvinella palmiformis]